jgi:hypothetical protein
VKRLLIVCLLALFLVPAAASATIPKPDPPVSIRHENGPVLAAPAPRVTTTDGGGGDTTLAVVLAASALGIALGGAGYVAFRVRPMLHSS